MYIYNICTYIYIYIIYVYITKVYTIASPSAMVTYFKKERGINQTLNIRDTCIS